MSLKEITLQQLRTVLAIASTGSISAASRSLKVGQPVLTRSLKHLEQQLGVPLVLRTPRGATLTDYGHALVARAQRIEHELQCSMEEIGQMQGAATGKVSIACSPVPMMLFVPAAIAQMKASFPRVEVRVIEDVYPDVIDEIRESNIDFAVGPVPDDGLGRDYRTESLLGVGMVVAARSGHPRARARSLAELQDQEWIVMGPPGGPGAVVEPIFREHGLSVPPCTISLTTVWAAFEVIKHTNLLGFVPAPIATAEPGVTIVPVREAIRPLRVDSFMRAQTILTPAARALLSAIRSNAAQWKSAHPDS